MLSEWRAIPLYKNQVDSHLYANYRGVNFFAHDEAMGESNREKTQVIHVMRRLME